MANSNSRNEYLQSLNRMRSNYQSSGNVLVNPSDNSTNVGTDISSFAYMNTPVQVPKQATKVSDESFYSKLVATGNEITGNVQRGFLDFVDGIIDAVVWGAGGVGKVFGGSDEWAKNVIEHDWQSQVILFSQQLNNAFRLDNFYDPNARENYIEGWSVLGDYQKSKEYLDQMYNNSYSQDLLGEKGQDVYQGLLQTVGNVLPSIAIGGLGLPAKVAQGVSLGTMGVSSFGSGTEQALQEGANYEQAGASGVISAGVETVSELIPLPFLNNRIGNIGSKITNKTVKEIGKAMLEEGSEEVISELLSPLSQLPYKDISEIEGSSFGDLAMAFVGGAIGGGLGGGTEITRRNITYSKKGADTLNLGMEISETIEEAQKEFQKGDKRDNNKMLEYQKQITEGTKLFKEQLEQIKLDDEKNGTNYYEKIVEVLKAPQSVTDYFEQSIEQREAKNVETQLRNLTNGRNVSVKIVSDQEYLSNPRNIGSRAYNITKTTTDGKTSTEIVIRESKVDKFYELVAHEGIAHGVIDLNKNAKRNIIDYVNSDKTFKKEFEEDLEKAKQLYKGKSNEVIESETLARFLERYVKNSSSLSKITDSKAKKGIKKVLNNLKDYLSRNKLDKRANKLIKQINKAIDNIDKVETPKVQVAYSKEEGIDEEVKTEEEKPKRKMKPRDEFSIVRLIKDTANLNFDEYINLEDSREFIKNIRDYVDEQLQGNESNYKLFVNKNASIENLFRNFNLYHTNEKEYDKRLEQFVDNLLNSNIKEVKYNDKGKIISSKQYIKLSEFLELTFDENYTLQDYKNETVEEIKLFLLAKSKATKSKRLREYFNNRIDRLTNKIIYYKNVNTYTLDTIQEVQKLNEEIGKVKIQNVIKSDGKVQAVTSMFHNAIKDIHVTKSGKGISPTSITHILKSFEGYNEELFNNHEGEFLISYNKDLFDLLDFFRKKTNSEGKFPQRELKLDELIAVNNLVGIIQKTVNDLISDQALLQREQNAQAKEEMLIAKGTDLYKGKDKLNFIEKEVAYATSFDISFGKWFGFNGDLYNIFIQDILDDYNRKLLKAHEYLQLFENAKKKHNIKDKDLNSFVSITDKNGVEHKMTYQNLIEIYVISRTDNGLLTLLDGGYTFKLDKGNKPHTIKFNDSTLNQVNELLSDNMKAFGLDVLGFYNTELRDYKAKADKKIFGTVLLQENSYYPLNKSDVSSNKLTDDELNLTHIDPTKASNLQESKNMKWKAIDGAGIEKRYRAYVDAITNYGETYESRLRLQNFTKSYTDGKSNLQIMKETIPFFGEMYNFYEKLITGESVSKGKLDSNKLFENVVSATLYGNASVVLKQTASIPTILNEVSLNSWVKGITKGFSKLKDYNGHVADLIENSGFLAQRWSTNEPIKAQTLSKEVGKLGKIFGYPMEKMDQAVIVLFAYTSAEYEAEARGFTRGTEEFNNEVTNILNRIVLNTQSNAVPLKMSPNRAGATNDFRRLLSVFSSDLQNKINYIIKYTEGYKNTVKRIKYIENRIKEIDEEIAKLEEEDKNNASLPSANGGNDDTSDNKAKIEELQELKKRLQKALEGEKQFIAKVPDQIKKLLVSLFLSALMIAGIEQLVSRLLGRKEWKWNEKDTSEFVNTLLIESTIGNIPYINQFINAMEYDQDLGGFQFTAFNEAIDSIQKIIQMAETGNYNFATLAYELATTLGYFTGIPVKNLYNIAMGIIKNVSPSGYKLDNYIKGYSEAYVYTAYKEALQDRNYRIAKGNLELLLDVYKGGSVSDETLEEMFALAKEGYNVTPTTNLSQYEDEKGNVIKLTNAQQKEFLSYYNQATTAVNEMIDITDYNSLDSENKAKAIKKLYSAYYYYGKAKVTGEIPDNKLAQLLYYSNGQIDVANYIASLQKIGNIQATEKNSRKELVLQELNKMRLSKNEKLLVLYLSGYKLSEENKIQLESYLRTKGIKEESLAL